MKNFLVALMISFALPAIGYANTITPQKLFLTNQYGEQSMNFVNGDYIPLPDPSSMVLLTTGTVTPTAATLRGYANTGSLYLNVDPVQKMSANLFINVGTITSPAWKALTKQ